MDIWRMMFWAGERRSVRSFAFMSSTRTDTTSAKAQVLKSAHFIMIVFSNGNSSSVPIASGDHA
jgi:hypothetical protein